METLPQLLAVDTEHDRAGIRCHGFRKRERETDVVSKRPDSTARKHSGATLSGGLSVPPCRALLSTLGHRQVALKVGWQKLIGGAIGDAGLCTGLGGGRWSMSQPSLHQVGSPSPWTRGREASGPLRPCLPRLGLSCCWKDHFLGFYCFLVRDSLTNVRLLPAHTSK